MQEGYRYDFEKNQFCRSENGMVGLLQLMWHITYRCDLQCRFCFAKSRADALDKIDPSKYIEKMNTLSVQKVDISGGEPLLCGGLPRLCNALEEKGIFMTLSTRGIGLADNVRWVIDNREKFARIIVSVDVPERALFERLSGAPALFDKTLEFIGKLQDEMYGRIRINTVVTRYLLDENVLDKMINLTGRIKCCEWCLIEPHPANRKHTFDEVAVGTEEFEQVAETARKKFPLKADGKLLLRYASNYSGYWVLYPEGILAKHTSSERDTMAMEFLDTPAKQILQQVRKGMLWIPEAKE